MQHGHITAEVITCPGNLGNTTFAALQLNVAGFSSPYVLTLAMRAIGYQRLSKQVDIRTVFNELACAVNKARISVDVAAPPWGDQSASNSGRSYGSSNHKGVGNGA
jgi:hypothetical protein